MVTLIVSITKQRLPRILSAFYLLGVTWCTSSVEHRSHSKVMSTYYICTFEESWRIFCFHFVRLSVRPLQNIRKTPILCCKYGCVWYTENPHFQYGSQADILENIQWVISPEPWYLGTPNFVWPGCISPQSWTFCLGLGFDLLFKVTEVKLKKVLQNLAFWRCPIDIFWMDWLRGFKFWLLDQYLGQVWCWLNLGPRWPTGGHFVSEPRITYICLCLLNCYS
jgi:hypothetical protein